jgi:hypothetical protein
MGNDRGNNVDELASQPIDERDEAALRQIAETFAAADPVPAGLVDRLKFAITLDALHAEISELQRTGHLVGARGETRSDVQTVTFTSQSLTMMITATPTGPDVVRIDGWAADAPGISVELKTSADSRDVVADDDGRFVFEDVPRGMAQFVVRHPEGSTLPRVVTPSLEL